YLDIVVRTLQACGEGEEAALAVIQSAVSAPAKFKRGPGRNRAFTRLRWFESLRAGAAPGYAAAREGGISAEERDARLTAVIDDVAAKYWPICRPRTGEALLPVLKRESPARFAKAALGAFFLPSFPEDPPRDVSSAAKTVHQARASAPRM